jgi:hypothetical protein
MTARAPRDPEGTLRFTCTRVEVHTAMYPSGEHSSFTHTLEHEFKGHGGDMRKSTMVLSFPRQLWNESDRPLMKFTIEATIPRNDG